MNYPWLKDRFKSVGLLLLPLPWRDLAGRRKWLAWTYRKGLRVIGV